MGRLLTRIHTWDGLSGLPAVPRPNCPHVAVPTTPLGFGLIMSPPVPTSCLSVHLTAFQPEEFVLSSCSRWSCALTCCLPASGPPCVLEGQSPGTGSSAPSSAVPAPLAAPSSLETHPRICHFSLQLIAHLLRGCCGMGPGGRGNVSLGDPSAPFCSPWHSHSPSSGSWVG